MSKVPPDTLADAAELLGAAAPNLGFFSLVALLERLSAGAPRVGETGPASEEALRLRHDPSLAFSTCDVRSVALRQAPRELGEAPRQLFEVVTTFLGLTGTVTPLPPYLAEEVAQEDPERSPRRDFLDLFHHRALALLYRLKPRYDLSSEYARGELDRWARRVLALAGLDVYERPPATRLPVWRLLRLAPLLAQRHRTAHMLEVALEDVLEEELEGARVTVQPFVGSWVELPEPERLHLGHEATATLGQTAPLGTRVFDPAGRFRVRIAPLSRQAYPRFLPEGEMMPVVRAVVDLVVRDPLEFDLELGLVEASPFALSARGSARLGRDTLIGVERSQETRLRFPAAQGGPV